MPVLCAMYRRTDTEIRGSFFMPKIVLCRGAYLSAQPDSTIKVFNTLLGSTAARTSSIFVHPRPLLACEEPQAAVSPPCRIPIVECISILDQLGKMRVLPHDAPREPLDRSNKQCSWQVSCSVLYCQRSEEGSCNAFWRAAPRN